MARQILVLAYSIAEANSYAKAVGLQRFTYRAVRNAAAIRGVRNAEVHILSSFSKRLDRHRILNELYWAFRRGQVDAYYVDFVNGEILDGRENDATFSVGGDGRTEQIEKYDDTSNGDNMGSEGGPAEWRAELEKHLEPEGFELSDDPEIQAQQIIESAAHFAAEYNEGDSEPSGETQPSEDPAPAEEPVRRTRRRRCSTGDHLVEAADLEAHEASEHGANRAAPVSHQGGPAPTSFGF